jgi:hypothetical protein
VVSKKDFRQFIDRTNFDDDAAAAMQYAQTMSNGDMFFG